MISLTRIVYLALAIILTGSLALLDYYLPEKQLVTVTGGEVKRVDKDGPIGADNPADGPTHDVYFIYTRLENGQVRVFSNEDTRWHFPFYFKFNSADIQAKAISEASLNKKAVLSSYGWRFNILSMFPNTLDVKEANDSPNLFSFIRISGFTIWTIIWVFILFKTRKLLKKKSMAAESKGN